MQVAISKLQQTNASEQNKNFCIPLRKLVQISVYGRGVEISSALDEGERFRIIFIFQTCGLGWKNLRNF